MDQKNLTCAKNMMYKTAVKTLERCIQNTCDYAMLVNGSKRIEYLKKNEITTFGICKTDLKMEMMIWIK